MGPAIVNADTFSATIPAFRLPAGRQVYFSISDYLRFLFYGKQREK